MTINEISLNCPATAKTVMIEEQIFRTKPAGRSGQQYELYMYNCREVSCRFRDTETCPIHLIQKRGGKFSQFP